MADQTRPSEQDDVERFGRPLTEADLHAECWSHHPEGTPCPAQNPASPAEPPAALEQRLVAELDALRKGVVAGLGLQWDSGAHGGMSPTDVEIVQWVTEDHEKLLRVYEGHHERAGASGLCPLCGMVGKPKACP